MLKGYLIFINSYVSKYGHKIEELYSAYSTTFVNHKNVINLLRKYIRDNSDLVEPLRSFFVENKIDVSQYYDVLRYPTNKKNRQYIPIMN